MKITKEEMKLIEAYRAKKAIKEDGQKLKYKDTKCSAVWVRSTEFNGNYTDDHIQLLDSNGRKIGYIPGVTRTEFNQWQKRYGGEWDQNYLDFEDSSVIEQIKADYADVFIDRSDMDFGDKFDQTIGMKNGPRKSVSFNNSNTRESKSPTLAKLLKMKEEHNWDDYIKAANLAYNWFYKEDLSKDEVWNKLMNLNINPEDAKEAFAKAVREMEALGKPGFAAPKSLTKTKSKKKSLPNAQDVYASWKQYQNDEDMDETEALDAAAADYGISHDEADELINQAMDDE